MLRAGLLALTAAIALYAINLALHPLHVLLSDVDLAVYRDAGLVAGRSPGQLYRWREPSGLEFTYTPFAAAFCLVVSVLPLEPTAWLMLAGSVAALLATVWLTFGALGWHGTSRLGAACAVSAVAFWTEPVQRTLHLGEVDLLLMLLVAWDLTSGGRRWQGAGAGVAAGVKLVALIFIRYLLLTRRYREAGAALGDLDRVDPVRSQPGGFGDLPVPAPRGLLISAVTAKLPRARARVSRPRCRGRCRR